MFVARSALALSLSLVLAASAAAEEAGNFVVRLGQDTTGVEHYSSSGSQLQVQQVGRAPRVLQRRFAYDFDQQGALTHAVVTITIPGAAAGSTPFQMIDARFTADSMMMENHRDTTVQRSRVAVPAGTVVITGASPWVMYQRQTMRLAKQKGDSLQTTLYYLGATNLASITVRKLGRDSMAIQTTNDLYHAHVDKSGRILNIVPLVGTAKFTVDRVASLDVPAMTASFAAREQQAGVMGALSPRDTVRASVGGASLWIDYGRPGKRGRTIFGGVVPWNLLWRTGANAATQFRTDKALQFGAQPLPAGTYTLWTIPSPTGWKFVVNSDTGEWGTEHKAEKDLFAVDMTVTSLPEALERFTISVEPGAQGGAIHLDWDTTRASVPFTVAP